MKEVTTKRKCLAHIIIPIFSSPSSSSQGTLYMIRPYTGQIPRDLFFQILIGLLHVIPCILRGNVCRVMNDNLHS